MSNLPPPPPPAQQQSSQPAQSPAGPQQSQQPPQANVNPRNNYNNAGANAPNNSRHHYNNNTNSNKPYRKNYNKDGQYQQAPAQYSPYYQQVMYGYPQQQYYYGVPVQPYDQYAAANAGYYTPPQNYQLPEPHVPHKAVLTDKSGNNIQFKKPTHSRAPSTASSIVTASSTATPVTSNVEPALVLPNTPVQPSPKTVAPATTASSTAKQISDLERKARNDEFKAKIAARAAALQKAKEEKAKAEGSETPSAAENVSGAIPKAPEPVESKPTPVTEEPKKEATPPKVEPVPVTKEAKEEAKTIAEEVKPIETLQTETKKDETPVELAPVAEEKESSGAEETKSSEEEQKEELSEENDVEKDEAEEEASAAAPAAASETIPEEKVEPPVPSFTISKMLNSLRFARAVDAYKHKYPSTVTPPDARFSGSSKIKYDPIFLVQFQQPLDLPRDAEWDSKYGAKIVIPDMRSGSKGNDRSFSRNSSSQFGKGFIGNGPVQMRSQTNLRGANDFNSRSGSRQNSKRRNPKEKSSRNKQGSRRDRSYDDNLQEPHESQEPAEPVKPLEKSATRWVPRSRVQAQEDVKTAPDGSIILSEEEVNRKIKSQLNKLTLELFDVISTEIINIANQSKWEEDGKTLKTVIELTFAKACDEPHWSSVYAKLCTKMFTDISPDVKDTALVDPNTKVPISGRVLVRKYLLTRCQIEYEKGWTDKLPTNEDGTPLEPEMMSDEYYKLAAAKRRGLGLVRFIGELFSLSLLSEKIIIQCISGLVANIEDPSEDVLENLVQLLNTVGPLIDASRNQHFIEFMNTVFDRINTIINTVKMSSRIKFKLMDLVDLRSKRWKGKEGEKGPKTLTEIHSEAERKRLEEERNQNDRRQNSRRGNIDSRSNSSRGGNSNSNLASQWGSPSNRVSQNEIKSVGTIRNSERSGPMNNFKDSKSSKGGNEFQTRTPSSSSLRSPQASSPASQSQSNIAASNAAGVASPLGLNTRESSKREPGNMFAALEDHNDEDESASEEEQTTAPGKTENGDEEDEEEEEANNGEVEKTAAAPASEDAPESKED